MRNLFVAVFCALIWAQSGCSSPPAAAIPVTSQPYTRIANPNTNTVQLEIVLRKFVPPQHRGPVIWLAGVMHVGEPEYYRALQRFLDAQTVVLYEGVNTGSHQRHVHDEASISSHAPMPVAPPTGPKAGYSMQSTLASSLGLVFQLEAIDYDRTNFLNSDLSISQIQRIMEGNEPAGAPGQKGASNSSFDTLLQIMDGSSFLGSLFKFGMQIMASSPKLQAMAKLTLIEAIGRLKGDLSDMQGLPPEWKHLVQVLIQARNQNLMEDLKTEMKTIPRSGSIAVFYGAGHMDDLEKRVTSELHYRPVSETSLSAFSIDMHKSGISPTEAQFMRNLIKSEIDQMQRL